MFHRCCDDVLCYLMFTMHSHGVELALSLLNLMIEEIDLIINSFCYRHLGLLEINSIWCQ